MSLSDAISAKGVQHNKIYIFTNVNIKSDDIRRNCFVYYVVCLLLPPPISVCVMCVHCALCLLIKCYGVHNLSTKIIKRKTQFIAHTRTYARTHLPRSKRYNKLIYRLHALTIWVFELRDKSCSNTNTHTLTLSLLRKIHLHVSRHFH